MLCSSREENERLKATLEVRDVTVANLRAELALQVSSRASTSTADRALQTTPADSTSDRTPADSSQIVQFSFIKIHIFTLARLVGIYLIQNAKKKVYIYLL